MRLPVLGEGMRVKGERKGREEMRHMVPVEEGKGKRQ